MIIKVKTDLCCGARLCVKTAPEVYQLDELGYNKMDGREVPPGLEDAARRGAAICPESAIQLSSAKPSSR
jgi:ferredoxin